MKKGIAILLVLTMVLLSGCVATSERLETRGARAEKLMEG